MYAESKQSEIHQSIVFILSHALSIANAVIGRLNISFVDSFDVANLTSIITIWIARDLLLSIDKRLEMQTIEERLSLLNVRADVFLHEWLQWWCFVSIIVHFFSRYVSFSYDFFSLSENLIGSYRSFSLSAYLFFIYPSLSPSHQNFDSNCQRST